MRYEYLVRTQGHTKFSMLEGFGGKLEEMLNSELFADYELQGWELWQVNTLNDSQGTNGFVLIFRRPLHQN